jgi:hypothetical protein
VPAVALLILGLTLTPADIWRAPATDAAYKGFDANLIYATGDGDGGNVQVSRDTVQLTALTQSQPTVTFATTQLRKLNATADVTILESETRNQALRIGVWSPWTKSGYFVVFGPNPSNLIMAEALVDGSIGPNLSGGTAIISTPLGKYQLGATYQLTMLIDRTAGSIISRVSGPGITVTESAVTSQQFPAIFGNLEMSLSASASSSGPPVRVTLKNFVLALPHERSWAVKVSDPVVTAAEIALGVVGALLIVLALIEPFKRGTVSLRSAVRPRWGRMAWLFTGATLVYLAGNAVLIPLKGHPFDFGNEELYAYVSKAYGPDQLYYLANVVSRAQIARGAPYLEAAFPYGPVVAYLFAGIGWVTSTVFAGGEAFASSGAQVGYVIKSVNVLFGLADGVLIYLILREIKLGRAWSFIASALFLFNPAVWFSMSVWGQTHVFSLFFVLAAVLFAEKHHPFWAWLALAAACLTRPQMLVFGLLLGIVFLRKFTLRENALAVSWTVIVSFIAWLPLTLATSPSLPVDIILNNFHVQEGGGNQAVLTTVSQSAFSIWPLVTYMVQGASGVQRAFTESSTRLVGSLTYQQISQGLTLVAMLLVSAALAFRKRAAFDTGGYLPLVALGVTSFLMLLTGLVATHFLLALPFLLLCRRWMGTVAYLYVAAIWTISTLIPMLGEMAVSVPLQQYPLLAGQSSAITNFVIQMYNSDRFITTAIIANICAVIWLAYLIFRRDAPSGRQVTTA